VNAENPHRYFEYVFVAILINVASGQSGSVVVQDQTRGLTVLSPCHMQYYLEAGVIARGAVTLMEAEVSFTNNAASTAVG